ncbi:MAG TPA: DUF116 domain-containing protein [Bacteroidales bacterium]|nr:DUF116 domain-containing protein [Bacteroidales bacterium]
MYIADIPNVAIEGKTYSLFGNSSTTDDYYNIIKRLADQLLKNNPDIGYVIETINQFSSKKQYLRKITANPQNGKMISDWLNLIDGELKKFTIRTEDHLKNLPLSKIWDRRLGTTREQYHLYMLEIELTNRLFRAEFVNSDRKIALTPYCLRNLNVNCKADKNDFDYQCKHCSSICFQNQAGRILRNNNVEPYIWMGGNIKELFNISRKKGQRLGVLGIACIPELVWGMRKCRKYKIPAVGLPLNANRCIRWFGEFYPNSVSLDELEQLVKFC